MATIEIDGKKVDVEIGQSIIEAADLAGIHIPRFCYHKKLSVAANCRMCLVEVENMRKTLPACATPISDGMKVLTKSKEAIKSQQIVMEFLLINHPLDCPICDQGGECELQDVSMGYGEDSSHFTEEKRVVNDEDIGPLISTEMTRCIHCTRCVRFGEELAGCKELGLTDRGESARIGTYIKHSLQSELSGNVIDLCPVGALTSKPYRYTARAWELKSTPAISPHDCVGSNLHLHTKLGRLMRVVPRENEAVNEVWLSDRDRFAYTGLEAQDRLTKPHIKQDGNWLEVDWQTALNFVVEKSQKTLNAYGPDQFATLVSPNTTLEEQYLAQKLSRQLGIENIDHRLRQIDFSGQDYMPADMSSTLELKQVEHQNVVLLVGSHIHHEQAIIGLKLNKMVNYGGEVFAINPVAFEYHFSARQFVRAHDQIVGLLTHILKAVDVKATIPSSLQSLLMNQDYATDAKLIATRLSEETTHASIMIGAHAINGPHAGIVHYLCRKISEATQCTLSLLTDGCNTTGGHISGVLPHRLVGGAVNPNPGLHAGDAIKQKLKAYFLVNVEPDFDVIHAQSVLDALQSAEMVVLMSSYLNDKMLQYADVILPLAPFNESAGTYMNFTGQAQSFQASAQPRGEAKPGWKILRVLGNMFGLDGFDFTSSEAVLAELNQNIEQAEPAGILEDITYTPNDSHTSFSWATYSTDAITRRSMPLQASALGQRSSVHINEGYAQTLGLLDTQRVLVQQGDNTIELSLRITSGVPDGHVHFVQGNDIAIMLNDNATAIKLTPASTKGPTHDV